MSKIQISTVRANGFSMDYFRFGCGDKTFVIFPGLSVESVMNYADTVAEAYGMFAEEFTVFVFDRRKELPAAYSVYDMAEDTAAAFRELGLDRISLFGASQGGMIAMAAAAGHPGLVSKLVLGSTAAWMGPEQYRTIDQWVRLAKAGDAKGLYLAFGESVYPRDVFDQSRDLLLAGAANVTKTDLKRFCILAEGCRGFDLRAGLKEIRCPVLAIGSRDDRVLGPEGALQIAEQLEGRPDFELYLYDGYGHAAYDTAPDYKERILRFLLADVPRAAE